MKKKYTPLTRCQGSASSTLVLLIMNIVPRNVLIHTLICNIAFQQLFLLSQATGFSTPSVSFTSREKLMVPSVRDKINLNLAPTGEANCASGNWNLYTRKSSGENNCQIALQSFQ